MIRALKRQPNRALLRTVTAVASCPARRAWSRLGRPAARSVHRVSWRRATRRGRRQSRYARRADRTVCVFEREDVRCQPGPADAGTVSARRSPAALERGRQDGHPPHGRPLAQAKIDFDALEQEYSEAEQAAGSEPEPRLLYGLLLMKRKDGEGREKAMQHFQTVKSQMPDRILPYAALAWLRMDKRTYAAAVNELTAMVAKIPKQSAPEVPYSAEAKFLFRWTGQLREHAAGVGESTLPLREALAGLDAAIAAHGPQAVELYDQGRRATAAVLADFDARMADSKDETEVSKLKVDRKQLSKYAEFPLDKYIRQVLLMLDQ